MFMSSSKLDAGRRQSLAFHIGSATRALLGAGVGFNTEGR